MVKYNIFEQKIVKREKFRRTINSQSCNPQNFEP
jgi:hypothetical protein